MLRRLLAGLGLLLPALALAQTPRPTPAPPQTKPILLTGATVHVGDGQTVIADGAVAFAGGKLTYVGPAAGFSGNRAEYDVRDVAGQQVYPGLILPNTSLGLVEIDAVRATVDDGEVGELNPHVRALIAYNPDNAIIPTVRTNGVLIEQVCPRGGTISGQSSVVQLDAWNWEDAAVKPDDGLHLNWPRALARTGVVPDSVISRRQKARDKALLEVDQLFADARAYLTQAVGSRPANLRLAALSRALQGQQTVFLHADAAKEIVEGVRFLKKAGVAKITVVGADDAARVLDFLRETQVSVVLGRLHALPRRTDDNVDAPFRLPAQLRDAGIPFCLSYEGDMEGPGARNIAFTAGTAAAYGLTREQALAAVTSQAARVLGLDERLGTLTVGKDATVVVSQGDLLDMRANAVTNAFIQGRQLTLTNHQQALYEQYRQKYGLK